VVQPEWIGPGTHVTSVGYAPPGGELPRELAERHRLFVETRLAFQAPPAGCAELAGLDPERGTELGEVLVGRRPGRQSAGEVTVYKAMGHAMEDLVTASLVYRRAADTNAGQTVAL
jgi:ornithine cyclodeaminase/alanine dehydrogenase-like protein (mu-crystallin family)